MGEIGVGGVGSQWRKYTEVGPVQIYTRDFNGVLGALARCSIDAPAREVSFYAITY